MKTIVDASSLIVLARLDGLVLLRQVLGVVLLTREVEAEVVTVGKTQGYRDATLVERAIGAGSLVVIDRTPSEAQQVTTLLRNTNGLSQADGTTIVCARERGHALLVDDRRARRVAMVEGVRCLVVQLLPFYGYFHRRLAYSMAREWTTKIGQAMRPDPVVLKALAAAMAEIAALRGETEEERT